MIWLIDSSLRDHVGHYFHNARSLYQYAVDHHFEFSILGHREVSSQVTNAIPVEPVFRYDLHSSFDSRWIYGGGFFRANFEFYRDLRAALQGRVSRESVLFMPMVSHRQLLAWAWWLRSQPLRDAPAVVLMFRLSYFDVSDGGGWHDSHRLARFSFKVLEALAGGRRIRIATDSNRLAREYSQLTRLPVEVFPIPHTEDVVRATALNDKPIQRENLRFVALGDAREEKGFPLLVEAIRILHDQGALQGVQFTLQCHIGSHYHAAMLDHCKVLEEMRLSNVHLLTHPLDTAEYYRLLSGADIVVLPYSRRAYYARTSGPLVEAFAGAKPVIVTDDTWMSDQLARFGAGVTFQDGDASGLAQAMLEACTKYPELAAQARANRSAWIDFHNPKAFFQMLLKSS